MREQRRRVRESDRNIICRDILTSTQDGRKVKEEGDDGDEKYLYKWNIDSIKHDTN